MEGPAHERALDESALGERLVQAGWLQVDEPRPQRDVRRRGLLSLQPADRFDRRGDLGV